MGTSPVRGGPQPLARRGSWPPWWRDEGSEASRPHELASALVAVGAGYLAGSVPFSNLAARRLRGVDLRTVGTGTVSGTSLHEVAGIGPLMVVGVVEVAKGALGPALARRHGMGVAAVAGAAAVAAHDWSPWLHGAGGRGISPALGALLVTAPAGTAVLLAGLAGGRLLHQTGLGSFVADVALVPVCAAVHGPVGAAAALAVLVPMVAKRLAGNGPLPPGRPWPVLASRLLFDRDGAPEPTGEPALAR